MRNYSKSMSSTIFDFEIYNFPKSYLNLTGYFVFRTFLHISILIILHFMIDKMSLILLHLTLKNILGKSCNILGYIGIRGLKC